MTSSILSRSVLGALVLAGLSVSEAGRAAPPAPRAPASRGVWKKHEVQFSQVGFSTTYSCSGLASKLKVLLRASGARSDVKVVPIGCGDPGRPNAFARARLTFYTLAPADAQDGQAGTWRRVTLASRSPRELESGDCELVERFRDRLLPSFVTRAAVDRTRCIPYQQSGSAIHLRFEVFAEPASD